MPAEFRLQSGNDEALAGGEALRGYVPRAHAHRYACVLVCRDWHARARTGTEVCAYAHAYMRPRPTHAHERTGVLELVRARCARAAAAKLRVGLAQAAN
eukprot:2616716-Pleurochrysis_carterae.AAC.1